MPRIVPSSTPRADIRLAAEDINKFSLPLIAELGAQNDGSHGCGSYRFWRGFCLVTWLDWIVESERKNGRKRGLMNGGARSWQNAKNPFQ